MTQPLISKDIVDLQDIEKVQFLQTLQANPQQYQTYVDAKTDDVMREVVDMKRASFAKMSADMGRLLDMDHNSRAALARTEDLMATQEHILQQQEDQVGAIRANIDTTRRQVEINNWYYENKRETLFVLQLMLLTLLLVTLTLGGMTMGFLGESAGNYLMGLFIIIGAGTWLYRWYYTAYVRDPMYWSRRNFKGDGKIAPPSGQICIGADGETRPSDSSSQ
jgi:hypothetical protein